ncbi:MAG: hypothetical protein J6S82_10620 [Bacteroidales bacterium]|nr:hypothetical protein [Bacteroidales bacterium]
MSNPLFNALGGGSQMGNMMQMLGQLKQNPMALLQRVGFNIPGNINSPQDIIQHLTRTGQINQNQLNQAQQMAQMFGGLK